jgi:hypothetical protein
MIHQFYDVLIWVAERIGYTMTVTSEDSTGHLAPIQGQLNDYGSDEGIIYIYFSGRRVEIELAKAEHVMINPETLLVIAKDHSRLTISNT